MTTLQHFDLQILGKSNLAHTGTLLYLTKLVWHINTNSHLCTGAVTELGLGQLQWVCYTERKTILGQACAESSVDTVCVSC